MGIMDSLVEFSDAQTLGTIDSSANPVTSTNVIDLGAAGKDAWGNTLNNLLDGGNICFNVMANNANSTGAAVGTAKIAARLFTHTAATSIHTGTEVARIEMSHSASDANYAVAGARFGAKVGMGHNMERYLGVSYIGVGGNPADSTTIVDAWLSLDTESQINLAA